MPSNRSASRSDAFGMKNRNKPKRGWRFASKIETYPPKTNPQRCPNDGAQPGNDKYYHNQETAITMTDCSVRIRKYPASLLWLLAMLVHRPQGYLRRFDFKCIGWWSTSIFVDAEKWFYASWFGLRTSGVNCTFYIFRLDGMVRTRTIFASFVTAAYYYSRGIMSHVGDLHTHVLMVEWTFVWCPMLPSVTAPSSMDSIRDDVTLCL